MSFINESQLRGYKASKSLFSVTEGLKGYRNESKYLKTKVFLSHKHDEVENLAGAIEFLKKEGTEVYVDWQDDGMPKTTSILSPNVQKK